MRETDSASNQFLKCSPLSETHKEIHRELIRLNEHARRKKLLYLPHLQCGCKEHRFVGQISVSRAESHIIATFQVLRFLPPPLMTFKRKVINIRCETTKGAECRIKSQSP